MSRLGSRHDMLDDKHARLLRRRSLHARQDRDAFVVVPIVQDHLQTVGIGYWHFAEHVSGNVMASVGEPELECPKLVMVTYDIRLIQHHAAHVWISLQDCAHQVPMAARDIAKSPDARQIAAL